MTKRKSDRLTHHQLNGFIKEYIDILHLTKYSKMKHADKEAMIERKVKNIKDNKLTKEWNETKLYKRNTMKK